MTHSHRFVEEFSRFLRLLHDEPAAVVAQKEALRGARDAARDGDVVLAVGADGPTLNGMEPHTLPSSVAGALRALAARLSYHGLRELRVYAGVVAAELLTAGRRLAADDALADPATLRSLENVRLVARPAGSFATPARPTPSVVRPFRAPAHDAAALRSAAAIAAQPATPRPFGTPVHGSVVIPATERSDEIIVHAAPAADDRALNLAQLFERLAACTSSKAATRYLDELATRLEEGVRRGKTELVAEVLLEVVRREGALTDEGLRLAYTVAVRRMSAPSHLRIAAQMLPRHQHLRESTMAVLARAGEEGADAVIEQLVTAKSSVERRSYFNALVKLQAGVASLVHMLGDGRWYVVRNAADLLGEMGTTAADEALVAAMDHPDARVRRSIVLSLGKLATPRCRTALEEALRHASPERRMVAAQAMAGIRDLRSGAALRRQLEDEGDPAVQHTLLAALGRLATRDAVEALVLAAAPRRKLFRRKASAYRVAAAHALADAGTPAALAALTRLCEDEEREVREVAQRLARPADGTSGPARPVTPTPSYVPVSAEGDPPPADPQPDDASAAAPHPAAG